MLLEQIADEITKAEELHSALSARNIVLQAEVDDLKAQIARSDEPAPSNIPDGARIQDHTDLVATAAVWDAEKAAWRTELSRARTRNKQDGGWGRWGAVKPIPYQPGNDLEYTITWEMMVPSGLDTRAISGAGFMKLMRVRTRKENGDHVGYTDLYESGTSSPPGSSWGFITEGGPDRWAWLMKPEPERGVFHTYEYRVVFSADPTKGLQLLRVDGELMGVETGVTLNRSTDQVGSVYFMTYYNGESKTDQVRWFRNLDVVIE